MTVTPPVALVAFDLDGVVYDFEPMRRLVYLAELTGRDPAWIKATIWDSSFEREAEAGAYTSGEDYLRAFNQRLGVPITREQWVMARRRAMAPRPAMLALLASLRQRTRVAVLTNNGVLVRETLPLLAPELWALLGDQVHVSADFGARKPAPAVYQRLAARYDVAPEQIVFVDDAAANVAGARDAGLQAILFESEHHLAALLASLTDG